MRLERALTRGVEVPYPGIGFSCITIYNNNIAGSIGTEEAVVLLWKAENGAALAAAGKCAREHELRRQR